MLAVLSMVVVLGSSSIAWPRAEAAALQSQRSLLRVEREHPSSQHESDNNYTVSGLPLAPGAPVEWLQRGDGLVIDARQNSTTATGGKGGILLVTIVNTDAANVWGNDKGNALQVRPRWLRSLLAVNRAHVKAHGHAMVIRWRPTSPLLTDWQIRACEAKAISEEACQRNNERENINWEKHLMLLDYLQSPENFSHVLLLDADAAFVRPELDSISRMAAMLDTTGGNLFAASEDWLKNGADRLNGGMLLAKNVPWTRNLFQDLWECHRFLKLARPRTLQDGEATCDSNEQIALDGWKGRVGVKGRVHLASGRRWNRGGETLLAESTEFSDKNMFAMGLADPELEIIHFMGNSKYQAADFVCNRNLTGEGQSGYGCAA